MSMKPEYDTANFKELHPGDWVQGHADYLYRFAVSKLNDKEYARDIIQDTFLAGLENTAEFQFRCSERTWLTSILKNKIYRSYYRKTRKKVLTHAELSTEAYFEFIESAADGHLDNDPMVRKEFYQALNSCLQRLPKLWQQVFDLKYLQDEPTAVICEQLAISPGNLWVICHRIKAEIRCSMKIFL